MTHSLHYFSADHIRLDGVSVLHGTRRVLDDVSATVSPGERVGLIGANGSGKSTMLALISRTLDAQSATGSVAVPSSLGTLEQELEPVASVSVHDVIEHSVARIRAIGTVLEESAVALDDPAMAEQYEQALIEAEHEGLWHLDARIESVLDGLGLGALPRERPIAEISGGQRRRLALAALLLRKPSALLLDEPTNHLDVSAVTYLEQELLRWRGPVLLASHDRAFLDAVATSIIDLDPAVGPGGPADGYVQGRRYTGGFSDYLAECASERVRWQLAYDDQQLERSRLEHTIAVRARNIFHTTAPRSEGRIAAKFEADRAAKTVGGRLRRARNQLAEIDRSPVARPPQQLSFVGFRNPHGLADDNAAVEPIAEVDNVSVAGRLASVSLAIGPRSRILIDGPNGAGKSTLLSILAGKLTPESGFVRFAASVGTLAQDDQWADLTVSADAAYRVRLRRPESAPSLVELGLLDESAAELPLASLSYGQRRRVALAPLVAEPPELLLLDEPTNHLALALAEELEAAIRDYPGAVVIASHDRWLRKQWRGEVVSLTSVGDSGQD